MLGVHKYVRRRVKLSDGIIYFEAVFLEVHILPICTYREVDATHGGIGREGTEYMDGEPLVNPHMHT